MTKTVKIVLTTVASLILLLVLVNILIGLGNQSIQAEVGERQQMIAQTIQLEALNRQVITVLVNLALKTNDEQLKKLLAESGVNLSMVPEASSPARRSRWPKAAGSEPATSRRRCPVARFNMNRPREPGPATRNTISSPSGDQLPMPSFVDPSVSGARPVPSARTLMSRAVRVSAVWK